MKYVLVTVEFRNVDSVREKNFAGEMKEREWNREIQTAPAWWKRFDQSPEEKARTEVERAARDAGIHDYNVALLASGDKPRTF